MDHNIPKFYSGVHNLDSDENIPKDAAQDAKNFVTKDGKEVLAYGKAVVGNELGTGKIYAIRFGYKRNGTKVKYRKAGTAIQYLNGSTWTDIVTGLTENAEYTFNNYSTLAGAFTLATGVDGIYKFNNDSPGSYLSLYNASRNDKGYSLIDKGRLIMWNLSNASKTTLKQSFIDAQDGTVYTTVSAEVLGASGTNNYTGTLAAKTATRNVFAIAITGTTGAGVETFTDNKDGTLTGNLGGTGTINYITGVYNVTFNGNVTSGNVTCTYQWEDSNQAGITDFTFSSTRVAGEGNRITQDIGGDAIITVLVGPDGAYYSIKEQSTYRLEISADDVTFTNKVYRRDLGIKFLRGAASTSKGIVLISTANPDKPKLTLLQKNLIGDSIEPSDLFNHFDFSQFEYDDACIDTFGQFIAIACKTVGADENDRILLCNPNNPVLDRNGNTVYIQTVDITGYAARMFEKDEGILYGGSPISKNVYKLYNGFDDDSSVINAFWTSKGETYGTERLKKYKKRGFTGLIGISQVVEVYESYDDAGFSLIGTIRGDAAYVDYSNSKTIGSNMIGTVAIGGGLGTAVYPYFMEIKVTNQPKFRKRVFKLVPTEIGYFDFEFVTDKDILLFEQRIPKRFRQKQNVSADGTLTDQ